MQNILSKIKDHKKILFLIIEIFLVYNYSHLIISIFNNDVVIKALHLDDLHNLLLCLKSPNLKDWIFPYVENRIHYRPVFYFFLLKYYDFLGTNISLVPQINFHIFSFVTTVIYYVCRSLKLNRIMSAAAVIIMCVINFNYYEIYQVIGFIEGIPLMLSLIILSLSIKNLNAEEKKLNIYSLIIAVLFLIMVFTHERYFPIMLIPILSVLLNKLVDNKTKIIFLLIYGFEIFFFFAIRFYHLGIFIPRGTDSTNLVEHFSLIRSLVFILFQFMYLLGINLGPEYLCAIHFTHYNPDMMPIILMSAIMLIATVVCYINVIKKRNEYVDRIDLRIDLFFILYILLCILQSSLTIRVELRFLLSSFMGLFIYLCHMVNVSSKDTILPYYNVKKTSPRIKFTMLITFSIFFICKVISCIYFKSVSENIFIINEQKVINGFYDATMGSYDVETLKSKNILITSNNYKTFIDEEFTHFFDQFDRKISDRVIIEISSDPERLLEALTNDDIILYEAPNYKFEEFKKE